MSEAILEDLASWAALRRNLTKSDGKDVLSTTVQKLWVVDEHRYNFCDSDWACAVPQPLRRETAFGERCWEDPRGYDPLVAGRSPRKGGRERSERESKLCWQEKKLVPPPRR